MKYYLQYVENACPKIKVFKTPSARDKFITKFNQNNPTDDVYSGYWIEYLVDGEIASFENYKKGQFKL